MNNDLRLIVKNVGLLDDVDITFHKNTVLVGKNSTGKTTVLQILYALKTYAYSLSEEVFKERLKREKEDYKAGYDAKSGIDISGEIVGIGRSLRDRVFSESWNSSVGIKLGSTSFIKLTVGDSILFTTDNCKSIKYQEVIDLYGDCTMISSTRVLDYASIISHAEYNKKNLKGSNYVKACDIDLVKTLAEIESDVIITDDYNNIKIKEGDEYILASNYSSGHKIFRVLQTLMKSKKQLGLMILDEPEQGCTPKMQLELAEIFRFSEEQFIFTTHSDFIVNYLIGDKDTRFYITRKSENGKVIIKQADSYDEITNMFMWYNKRGGH